MKHNNVSGFTLIELLIVIAIIGILSTIVISSLSSSREKALDAKRKVDTRSMVTALEMYALDHGTYPFDPSWESCIGCPFGGAVSTLPDQWNKMVNILSPYMSKVPGVGDNFTSRPNRGYLYSYYVNTNDSPLCLNGMLVHSPTKSFSLKNGYALMTRLSAEINDPILKNDRGISDSYLEYYGGDYTLYHNSYDCSSI